MKQITQQIKIVELFAGIGGFRLGFEKNENCKVVWSNQWEPSTKIQHASNVYVKTFGENNHSNKDINKVKSSEILKHNLLCAGFPCQDYSVANILSRSKGLEGDKGALWWQIIRIAKYHQPEYLLLENVDRLLKSPANHRGRDFTTILKSLAKIGYGVEWRVIDASEYGMPQRRKRVFIFCYHKTSTEYKQLKDRPEYFLENQGIIAKTFRAYFQHLIKPVNLKDLKTFDKTNIYENAGVFIEDKIYTTKYTPLYKQPKKTIRSILQKEKDIPEEFYITEEELPKWKYLKGAKRLEKVNKKGQTFIYAEGSMSFPDSLKKPSRTIITAEGGNTPSRFKHIIEINGRYRRLTPIELERLSMFPDNHTDICSNSKRAFLIGNALVVGVVEALSKRLI